MSNLDDRLNRSLGGAYRDTFGTAPAILPSPARGRGVVLAASVGAVGVVAVVAVPIALAHTLSGKTVTPAAGHGAVLQTGTPVCGPADVTLTAVVNHPSFALSVIKQTQPGLSQDAFVSFGLLTGVTDTPCRSFRESESLTFITPGGANIPVDGPSCLSSLSTLHNRTGAEPVVDPLATATCRPGPILVPPSESPSDRIQREQQYADATNDYGVLVSSTGSLSVPADGIGDQSFGNQLYQRQAGHGASPEPDYRSLPGDYMNDPLLTAPDGWDIGTWKVRITYGNLTAETPFQVTAG